MHLSFINDQSFFQDHYIQERALAESNLSRQWSQRRPVPRDTDLLESFPIADDYPQVISSLREREITTFAGFRTALIAGGFQKSMATYSARNFLYGEIIGLNNDYSRVARIIANVSSQPPEVLYSNTAEVISIKPPLEIEASTGETGLQPTTAPSQDMLAQGSLSAPEKRDGRIKVFHEYPLFKNNPKILKVFSEAGFSSTADLREFLISGGASHTVAKTYVSQMLAGNVLQANGKVTSYAKRISEKCGKVPEELFADQISTFFETFVPKPKKIKPKKIKPPREPKPRATKPLNEYALIQSFPDLEPALIKAGLISAPAIRDLLTVNGIKYETAKKAARDFLEGRITDFRGEPNFYAKIVAKKCGQPANKLLAAALKDKNDAIQTKDSGAHEIKPLNQYPLIQSFPDLERILIEADLISAPAIRDLLVANGIKYGTAKKAARDFLDGRLTDFHKKPNAYARIVAQKCGQPADELFAAVLKNKKVKNISAIPDNPELQAKLDAAGIGSRDLIIDFLMASGLTRTSAISETSKFVNGHIVGPKGLYHSARRIAEKIGELPEALFASQIKDYQSTSEKGQRDTKPKGPRKPRLKRTKSVTDYPIITAHPELKPIFGAAGLATRRGFQTLFLSKGVAAKAAYSAVNRFLSDRVLDKRGNVSAYALWVAEKCGHPATELFAPQLAAYGLAHPAKTKPLKKRRAPARVVASPSSPDPQAPVVPFERKVKAPEPYRKPLRMSESSFVVHNGTGVAASPDTEKTPSAATKEALAHIDPQLLLEQLQNRYPALAEALGGRDIEALYRSASERFGVDYSRDVFFAQLATLAESAINPETGRVKPVAQIVRLALNYAGSISELFPEIASVAPPVPSNRRGPKAAPPKKRKSLSEYDLIEAMPDLEIKLRTAGMHDRSEIIDVLLSEGMTKSTIHTTVGDFLANKVVDRYLSFTKAATHIAKKLGEPVEILFAAQMEAAHASYSEREPKPRKEPKAPRKSQETARFDDFPLFVSYPELLESFKEGGLNSTYKIRDFFVSKGILPRAAMTATRRVLHGKIFQKNRTLNEYSGWIAERLGKEPADLFAGPSKAAADARPVKAPKPAKEAKPKAPKPPKEPKVKAVKPLSDYPLFKNNPGLDQVFIAGGLTSAADIRDLFISNGQSEGSARTTVWKFLGEDTKGPTKSSRRLIWIATKLGKEPVDLFPSLQKSPSITRQPRTTPRPARQVATTSPRSATAATKRKPRQGSSAAVRASSGGRWLDTYPSLRPAFVEIFKRKGIHTDEALLKTVKENGADPAQTNIGMALFLNGQIVDTSGAVTDAAQVIATMLGEPVEQLYSEELAKAATAAGKELTARHALAIQQQLEQTSSLPPKVSASNIKSAATEVTALMPHEDPDNVLAGLFRRYPSLEAKYHEKGFTSLEGLFRETTQRFGGNDYAAFYRQLKELLNSPYNPENGQPKVAAKMLGLALGYPVEELLVVRETELRDAQQRVASIQGFATLIFAGSKNNLLTDHPTIAYNPTDYINRMVSWTRMSTKPGSRSIKVPQNYQGFATYKQSPIKDGNLTPDAAALVKFHKIDTESLEAAVPEFEKQVIYSLMVRDDLPVLAHAMEAKHIYTIKALANHAADIGIKMPRESLIYTALNEASAEMFVDKKKYADVVAFLTQIFKMPAERLLKYSRRPGAKDDDFDAPRPTPGS